MLDTKHIDKVFSRWHCNENATDSSDLQLCKEMKRIFDL